MEKILDIYFQSASRYTLKREEYDGKNYIVVPVVMMVEGVHSGSHGPILHTAEELGKIPESWNGIPVTIGHPIVDGSYVSANSPEVLKDWAVGQIFNTYMDGGSLKAEAWIDEQKIIALSPETLARLNSGEVIEVSIGVFSDEDPIDTDFASYGDEQYIAIARNHRPNHLALLPDEVGACSIEDGCGIRVNKKGEFMLINEKNQKQLLKELSSKGFSVNETGFNALASKAQAALNSKDTDNLSYYLEEIFQNDLIYQVYSYSEGNREVKYYRQQYVEKDDGTIEIVGDPVQVKREVNYPTVVSTNKKQESLTNNKEMAKKECLPCVKAAVDKLIANEATTYAETDREWLEGFTEEQLAKMEPITVHKEVEVTVAPTKDQALEVLKKTKLTKEEYLATMPEEIREQVELGLQVNAERRESMISAITANEESPWTEDELKGMKTPLLEKVYRTVHANKEKESTTDFSLFSTPKKEVEVNLPTMPPVGVNFED